MQGYQLPDFYDASLRNFYLLHGLALKVTIAQLMDIEILYQQTLDYLYSFVDYSLTRAFRNAPEKFDLARMVDFMEFLGNPHQSYAVIHVAGTKGKGSVCALCANALRSAGYRVGLYTSPHMEDYAERIQINGVPIPHEELIALVNQIRPELDKGTQLTTFEITTALAFLYFALNKVDVVVAEVGLGGRLDATNIITPKVSVITSLSLDHVEVLGDTLEKIAAEKAGIIKPNIPVVSSPQRESARRVLEEIAAQKNSPFYLVGRDTLFAPQTHSLREQTLWVWHPVRGVEAAPPLLGQANEAQPLSLTIPLLGQHQVENAATAYTALQVIQRQGFAISEKALQEGFATVRWPGRLEILHQAPFVVLDSAHNRDSACRLRQAIEELFPERSVILIFGVSEDKDVSGMLTELSPLATKLIVTKSVHPRAMSPILLAQLAGELNVQAQCTQSVEEAMEVGLRLATPESVVLITGSIFVAASARHAWYNQMVMKVNQRVSP